MEMIGTHEYAKKIGVSDGTVRRWCEKGYLKEAERDGFGQPWRIPQEAEPPAFRNKKRAISQATNSLYINKFRKILFCAFY